MEILKIAFLASLTAALSGIPAALAEREPLHVQNRYPLHLMFLTPRPTAARPIGEGILESSLSVDYSSVHVDKSSPQWTILMDMELAVADLGLAYGLTDRLTVRLNVPVVHMSGGFLDPFLEDYHRALGVPNYGREERPQNSFAYRLEKEGAVWLEGDADGLQLADMTVSIQWSPFSLTDASAWRSSWLTTLKLPTGDPSSGCGSGRMDVGMFLPLHYNAGRWAIFGMPGSIWHGQPKTQGADVKARPSFSMLAGVLYAHKERWHAVAQLNYFSSPLERTGIPVVDDGAWELTLGLRHILKPGWQIELALCEDIFTRAAPDFTVHLGVVRSIGFTGGP